ncbi:MAG: Rpn family recombination-promoting nuclease/putative transposase, partial [Bacteroidales bacterium]|nr:Rpn family recombination-promoting nuclease/putative transposase [Bacteroidales bacterium]
RGNEDLLLKLVNAILPELNIQSVSLSSQSQSGWRRDARSAVFDVNCIASDGHQIIIEMQYKHQDDFNDRMLFYSTFPIQNSLNIGEGTYRFKPTIVVGITDFILSEIKPNDRIINYYSTTNDADSEIHLSDNLHHVTVELPKLKKTISELSTPAELLFYAIRNIGTMDRMPEKYIGSGLEKLFEICKFAAMDEMTQAEYIHAFMAELDLRSQKRTAYNEGKEEGYARGKAEGKAEGRSEGEEQKALEIASSLKQQDVPPAVISKATGLSPEQIAAL